MGILSSLFFQKLTSRGAMSGEDGWHNVSRWAQLREGGVLRRRYLFLPINVQNKHWWLAVICNPISAFATSPTRHKVLPRIVCLDSSLETVPHAPTVGLLRGYLWREW